ncbi:hypothetical protein JAAARDRAFT_147164 [Jaapia argillacea MUCL 33604]|uniref:CSC1/OSCA1-like 7TM region domain-containing protein n=1 Tax=Jaapia argillacea MUCL 33604 TaxID=933084 RepID=A0A067Q856_9AGAM|nr:hypothetical protein JAAARDRAFT_147164 [Jaapia argillacea MUCL 33604]
MAVDGLYDDDPYATLDDFNAPLIPLLTLTAYTHHTPGSMYPAYSHLPHIKRLDDTYTIVNGSTFYTSAGATLYTENGSSFWLSGSSTIPISTSSPSSGSSPTAAPATPTSSGNTAGGSSSPRMSAVSSTPSSFPASALPHSSLTTFTTSTPITTITEPSTTITSYSNHVVTSVISQASPSAQIAAQSQPICIGGGIDAWAGGLIETLILPSAVGLLLWLLFAILRPRFRQVYALREWFPQQGLRPRPLGNRFWAFLFPHVPLVPSVPKDVSDAGRSPVTDAQLFPSDEQLSQRTLWIAFLIVFGWMIIGLAGALPLYMVNTPCLAHSAAQAQFLGVYSTLQDLSLLRLLQQFDNEQQTPSVSTTSFLASHISRRATPTENSIRIRIIILTALLLVLAVLPALYKIIKEFNRLVAFRKRWIEVRCGGLEMGWLSVGEAPGFVGWGEKRVKDFVIKNGLSSTLDTANGAGGNGNGNGTGLGIATGRRRGQGLRRNESETRVNTVEESNLEVDIQSLFSIGDTQRLALLIEERDEILENLEVAETKYISSFRLSTPDPSVADLLMKDEEVPEPRLQISRPRPLASASTRRKNRTRNPAYGSSSLTPTSFVAPSQYYKLGNIRGISGSRFDDPSSQEYPSLSDSVHQRVVGSRFQEINRNSVAYGKLPIGNQMKLDKTGTLRRVESTPSSPIHEIPDPSFFGPNHGGGVPSSSFYQGYPEGQMMSDDGRGMMTDDGRGLVLSDDGRTQMFSDDGHSQSRYGYAETHTQEAETHTQEGERMSDGYDHDWVDLMHEAPQSFDPSPEGSTTMPYHPQGGQWGDEMIPPVIPRPPRVTDTPPSDRRETFPLRMRSQPSGGLDEPPVAPPHLRLQSQGPFVRPISGLDHDDLGAVYADINRWRTQLKAINQEIGDAQRNAYNDIADGARMRGWLMIGKGLRFIPGVRLIEGRAKEDIRWDELQGQVGLGGKVIHWVVIVMVAIALAAGLTAVAGLALGNAPNVSHYLPFLRHFATDNNWITGLAVGLAPAVAAALFITSALAIVHFSARMSGCVSISSLQLTTFKTTFYVLTIVCAIWIIVVGSLLFAMDSFNAGSGETKTVADGSIYMSALALVIILNVAIISPALMMLQPFRLRRVHKAERTAVTPRQRFRAVYPRTYDASYATGCCVLAIVFASTFSLIFPLIGPAVVILLLLTLIAHRYLVGYVYGRTLSQTGGLIQIWLLRRFGTLLAFQPLLLGLILLTRRLWPEGGVLVGGAFLIIAIVEGYTRWKTREPGVTALSGIARNSLDAFKNAARPARGRDVDEESTSLVSSSNRPTATRMRGSFASVLEMMSMTLAVMPPPSKQRGPIPLPTETLDDLTATERAARTHPDAPPHLPPLPFADHAEEMTGILYAPELTAPEPIIWLPNDSSGIARSEAYDLQRYHDLKVTLDVKATDDVMQRPPSASRGGRHSGG